MKQCNHGPASSYTDGTGLFVMDDFGNAVYLDADQLQSWASFICAAIKDWYHN